MSERDRGPLTAAQRRLWFLNRLDPDDAAYNISACVLLRGDLDAARLVRAFDSVVAVHECLRTRFVEEDGEPLQEVLAPRPLPVHHADVADLAEARRAVEELVARPFDLAQGHLIRIGLLRLSVTEHVLCAVTHHSVGDGWSLNLLYRQAADAYRGIAPTPPGMRYLDHARAHQGDDEASTVYWRAVLDRPPVLELPLDRPRPARRTSAGICAERSFDDETWEMVQGVARELRCTPFMVLMTAYQLTLSQLSGQQDLCVATAVAGRDDVAAESVFGYFVRMLVLRADLSGDITVGDLVRRTRTACLGAFAHQEVPFEQLVADLGLARDPSHNPFFQATMTLHSTMDVSATGFDGADGFEGVTAEGFGDGSRRTLTDVAMDVFVTPTAINARSGHARMDILLTAAADLFDAETVDAMADRFTAVLRAVLADLDAPVRQLPLVDEAAAAELLRMGTGPALPGGPPLTEAVERAVAAAPEAVALRSGKEQVSYRQLWERSRELADALQAAGVRPGHLVGVAMPRGPEQIAALLAAWRSGAGYVPLDTALPAPRRDLLVEQSGVAAVVTPDGITPGTHTPVQAPGAAYVLFTSGSTGTPKPVLVGQAALRDRVAWMAQAYGTGPADGVVQFADLGFDTHAEEIWPTLTSGGTLVLLPGGTRSLPEVMAAEPAITVLDLPTAYWQALLDLDSVWPAALRLVILGGEQVDAAAVTRWRALHGDRIRLTNTYGPTEAGVIATAVDLTGGGQDGRRPPIGRPIGGVRAYLLDPAGRLVPRGSAGELCLAGAGLADGYLGRPDLTAERFLPDPYGDGRMYRTGDRARWRRDAPLLEFLGRLDRQLKVRGVRIEPGEVEAALTTHPDVGQAVVTAADQTLVAYVTGTAPADAVRAHAAEVLPALLVPGVVMVLPALPLTANGKVDLAALPAPAAGDVIRAAFQAPRTDAEHLVAVIFGELLGLDQVGAHDDFFVLGGHSLLAVRAIGRLRAAVGLDLPVRAMFEQPTVEGFAHAVEDALAAEIETLTDDEAAAELAARTGEVAADSFAATNEPPMEPVTRAGGAAASSFATTNKPVAEPVTRAGEVAADSFAATNESATEQVTKAVAR